MQGSAREIAVDLVRADGSRLPVLVNSVLRRDAEQQPLLIRTTVFDAVDRRSYERELLRARDRERQIAHVLQRSLLDSEPLRDPRLAHRRVLPAGGRDARGRRRLVRRVPGSARGASAWWSATSSGAASRRRRRWGSCAARHGRWRASRWRGPAQLLERLDRFAARLALALMATLVYAEIELDGGAVRYACAGHPPPLLVSPMPSRACCGTGARCRSASSPTRRVPRTATSTLAPGGAPAALHRRARRATRRAARPRPRAPDRRAGTPSPPRSAGPGRRAGRDALPARRRPARRRLRAVLRARQRCRVDPRFTRRRWRRASRGGRRAARRTRRRTSPRPRARASR